MRKKILGLFALPNIIHQRIHYKLVVLIMVLVAFPLIIVTSLATYYSSNKMVEETLSTNSSSVKQASYIIREKFDSIDLILTSLVMDESFMRSFQELEDSELPNRFRAERAIESTLYSIQYTNNERIKAVSLVANDASKVIRVGEAVGEEVPSFKKSVHTNRYDLINDEINKRFTFSRSINRFEDRKKVGEINIEVGWKFVKENFDTLKIEEESMVFLVNSKGDVIYNPYPQQLLTSEQLQSFNLISNHVIDRNYITTTNDYLFFDEITGGELFIVKVFPKDIIINNSKQILLIGVLVGINALIFSFFFTIIFAKRLSTPIINLANDMQVAEEQLSMPAKLSKRQDEIGRLENSYSLMIKRLNDLIEKEYKIELEKKDAQLIALQSKINPHFLYNTLQLIGDRALSNNGEQVYSIIQALSNMFRYVVRKQNNLVTVQDEVNHINEYLLIQKMRFSDKLEIEMYIEEEISDSQIPMLSIQPLVENAFIHGFESTVDKWKLSIIAQKVFDEIEITISDNGKGVSEEIIRRLRKDLLTHFENPLHAKENIGIKNVDSRIKLLFGEEYGVDIRSLSNSGTEVILRIPA